MNSFLSPFGAVVLLAVTGVVESGGSYGLYCSDKYACENGGTCDPSGRSESGLCTCPTGFSGNRCQKECSTSADCMNGATCQRDACTCAPGFTGGKCESMTAPAVVSGDVCSSAHPCANGGTCNTTVTGGACSCPTGYEGKRCQAACNTNADCKNKGTCESRGCKCTAGYTGGKCESVLSGADQVIAFPAAVLMYVVVQLSLKV